MMSFLFPLRIELMMLFLLFRVSEETPLMLVRTMILVNMAEYAFRQTAVPSVNAEMSTSRGYSARKVSEFYAFFGHFNYVYFKI